MRGAEQKKQLVSRMVEHVAAMQVRSVMNRLLIDTLLVRSVMNRLLDQGCSAA
jgi:hypothetical protein